MGGSIFISYRRETDSGFAGRLYDRLEHSFGRERVFIDVDSIAPGEDFVAVLQARVAACDVLLALIGRGWLAATDAAGCRRLDNPDDFVRIEIAAALAQGKRVIPVVIDDVPMPRAEDLPEEIKPLVRRQAIRLTHDRFKDDAERLVRALEKALTDADEVQQQAQDQERRRTEEAKRRNTIEKPRAVVLRWIVGGAIVLAAILGAIFVWPSPEQEPAPSVTAEKKAVTPSPPGDAEKTLEEVARKPDDVRAEAPQTTPQRAEPEEKRYGLVLAPLTPEIRSRLGLGANVETGAVVTNIERGGVADAVGLSAGDVIVEVNQQPVNGPTDVIEQLEKARAGGQNNLLLRILRGESHIFVALPLVTNGAGSRRGG